MVACKLTKEVVFLNKAEIEKLKKNAEEAFELKELWYEKLEQAELILISARKSRDLYLTELNALEDKRDWEYEVVKSSSRFYQEVWEEFEEFRNYKNSQIDLLRLKCETEHALMTECFDKAEFAYSNRDKHEASIYRSEGYEHKRRLTELHGEISRCEREIKDAKAEAEKKASKDDFEAFLKAEKALQEGRIHYDVALEEFKKFQKERDVAQAEYDFACATYDRIKKTLEGAATD